MNKLSVALLLILSTCSLTTIVKAQKISYSGWGAVGYKVFLRPHQLNGYNQEGYFGGKIQFDFSYNKNIEAQLDLRGNSVDNSIVLREFSAKFKYIKKFKIKLGNIKRPFGYQYTELNRENLMTIKRSVPIQKLILNGYGSRSISLSGYYKYSQKRPEYPYSYYLSFFVDNSQAQGVAGRFGYHLGNSAFAISTLYQNRGGDEPISTTGIGFDYSYESKQLRGLLEISYTGDPILGVINRLQVKDENVSSFGLTIGGSYYFILGKKVVKKIEPVLLISFYAEDFSKKKNHIIQTILGVNIYFHKNVLARLNGELRLTKNQYNNNYATNESRGIFELLIRF